MAKAIDGSSVPAKLETMKCGGTPMFDYESGCTYFCDVCFATIGSISQPQSCKDINDEQTNIF